MGFFDFIGDIIDFIVDESTYEEMYGEVQFFWNDMAYSGNEGQAAIAEDYVIPSGEDVINGWDGDWPDVDIGEYADACMDSHEAAEDCWSEAIQQALAIIETYQDAAKIMDGPEGEEGEEGDDGEEGEDGEDGEDGGEGGDGGDQGGFF